MFTFAGVSSGRAQVDPNDPWPMFGHDARHTCRSPFRGPHAEPQFRWSASLERERCDEHMHRAGGERIAGVRQAAVGTAEGRSDGHIVALRPPLGDFNGDGVCNNQDISPFILALLNESQWQASYGGVYGINLLGVGDCNNSGAFNNGDIDCMIDLLFGQDGPITEEDWQGWAELMWLRCYLDQGDDQ